MIENWDQLIVSSSWNKLDFWREVEEDDLSGTYTVENGDNQLKLLFERRDDFSNECQKYILFLIQEGRVERLVSFAIRIPKDKLLSLDFKDLPLQFTMSFYMKLDSTGVYGDQFDNKDYIRNFGELCNIWNGPTYEELTKTLCESLIQSVQNFDEKLALYDQTGGKVPIS